MADIKSKVSSSYIKEQLDKYGTLTYKIEYERSYLVVGARVTEPINIGGHIARALPFGNIQTVDKTVGDVTNVEFLDELFKEEYGGYDTLICCQGTTHLDWIENQTPSDISRQLHDSLMSHMLLTNKFVNATIDAPWRKCIIYVGSMAYRQVLNGSSIYCAAKAGLNMFARCMAWELAPKGYDVYIIHPGNVACSPMAEQTIAELQRYRRMDEAAAREYWNTGNPRDTVLTPDEIARLVCQLASGDYKYMAGNPIDLTGGQR